MHRSLWISASFNNNWWRKFSERADEVVHPLFPLFCRSPSPSLVSPELYFVLEWIRWSFFILHAALASGVSSSKEIGGEEEVEHLSHAGVNLLKWWDLVREEGENPRLHSQAALQSHFQFYFSLPPHPTQFPRSNPAFLELGRKSFELNSGDKTKWRRIN